MDGRASSEALVSFYNVVDAVERAIDAFEDLVLSEVNDVEAQRHRVCLI